MTLEEVLHLLADSGQHTSAELHAAIDSLSDPKPAEAPAADPTGAPGAEAPDGGTPQPEIVAE